MIHTSLTFRASQITLEKNIEKRKASINKAKKKRMKKFWR